MLTLGDILDCPEGCTKISPGSPFFRKTACPLRLLLADMNNDILVEAGGALKRYNFVAANGEGLLTYTLNGGDSTRIYTLCEMAHGLRRGTIKLMV